ncbi:MULTISPECIES: helix-turn-helix transcriptional regulator [Yersinia]|uniref:helix-turn-helix transcriptional regulator n=1 Tax=Yersinia TaxID=629 RepID=UPI00065D43CF|nr:MULTISPECIES: AlpA family phage regulatory protein [Yersinia]MCW8114260.1 AlpA family phage regulatory protein [Yersinia intermedia]MDA5519036.1 AlpA family phage regulatory protein [Yersinia intermedia]OWF86127.1 Rha family transcriptional regulator [Yersinia intermedia]WET15133.1 AlpA family phage regulatory protein [Yersinia intermedia]CRY79589.1 phage transcriptional regulator AlpA [Yersinia intermedia]
MNMIDIHNDKMVDMAFIVNFTGMTDKWFYKLIQDGKFPAPIKMGRSSRWLESDVAEWINNRVIVSRDE